MSKLNKSQVSILSEVFFVGLGFFSCLNLGLTNLVTFS
ncbi:hypothetical protein BVRB_5g098320 [Beta vulgaris subsp. vulgaris]|nr:hypothetical protein BVRB_5g098320 [Beta vulgaris subsp. vulgaris]